jgi:hypothetical protein
MIEYKNPLTGIGPNNGVSVHLDTIIRNNTNKSMAARQMAASLQIA